jgi:hypothetical protein
MRAADCLAVHAQLAELVRLPHARSYLAEMVKQTLNMRIDREYLADTVGNHVRGGYTFHVAAHMNQAVENVAAGLPETTQFGDIAPPTGCGVAVLDEPWVLSEAHGNDQTANVITWGPIRVGQNEREIRSGHLFTYWRHLRFGPPDTFVERLRDDPLARGTIDRFGGLYPILTAATAKDMRIGPYERLIPEEKLAEMRARGDDNLPETTLMLRQPLHLLLATWYLMDQTLATVTDEPTQRAAQRQAKRAGIPSRVTVVALRRQNNGEHTGAGAPLAWRVPVREHYQHYWVKDSATGERVRVRRAIGAGWRGPLDAPVRVTDKVYDLRR